MSRGDEGDVCPERFEAEIAALVEVLGAIDAAAALAEQHARRFRNPTLATIAALLRGQATAGVGVPLSAADMP